MAAGDRSEISINKVGFMALTEFPGKIGSIGRITLLKHEDVFNVQKKISHADIILKK